MRYWAAFLISFSSLANVFGQQDLQQLISQHQITGIQLSWNNGKQTVNQFAGFANLDEKSKVSNQTIFQAASLSKTVLAYICLELADQQKINLDLPLSTYYTYGRLSDDTLAKEITARMVLQHSSGLPNWAENPMTKSWATSKLKTSFKPGTAWKYAGEGYVYLQLVIQEILQKDLQQIADSLVFKPLEMKHSSFITKEEPNGDMAHGYSSKNDEVENTSFFLPNGAFSLTTTTSDYLLFLKAFVARQLKMAISQPFSVANADETRKSSYGIYWGLGVGIQKNELGTSVWHWGDNGSFKAFFMVYPSQNKYLVCFTNHENGLKLMMPLFDSFFGKATWNAVKWLND